MSAVRLAERRSIEVDTLENEIVHSVRWVVVIKEDVAFRIIARTREGHAQELAV